MPGQKDNLKYYTPDTNFSESLLNDIPNPTIITNSEFSICWVNPAFEKLTGFSLADVKGTRAPYPWWPESRHQEYLDELNVVKTGKKHKSEWLFHRKDGTDFWVKAAVNPVMENSIVKFMVANWTDITDFKSIEESLQSKLAELKPAQAKVLESISLKMQQPLSEIQNRIGTLLQLSSTLDRQREMSLLMDTDYEINRLILLLQDLIVLWQIESYKLALNRSRHTVADIFSAVSPRLKVISRGHKLKTNLSLELPAVYIDVPLIIHVLSILVSDAAGCSPPGSPIVIEAERSADGVMISVADQGPGLLPEVRENIFNLPSAHERPGVGVDLPLIRGIIEAHGGWIKVESEAGKGTKFSFILPAALMA